MLPSNLNLNKGKTVGYKNRILISNTGMKIGPNEDVNKAVVYHKKLPVTPPEPGRGEGAAHKMVKSADNLIKDCLAT